MPKSDLGHPSEFKEHIMNAIQEYPLIQHNQLLNYLVEHTHHMAKKTAEKYLRELINEKKIFEYKEGKIKKYALSSSFGLPEKLMKKQFDKWIYEIKKTIKKIEKDYPKYNTYMKTNTSDLLKSLHKSFQNIHNAYEHQEEYNYEDLGTQENILYNEIVMATDRNTDNSTMRQRQKAINLLHEIRKLKRRRSSNYQKIKTRNKKTIRKRESAERQ